MRFCERNETRALTDWNFYVLPFLHLAGTADAKMNLPSFRISFCANSGSDSATMDDIRYEQESTLGETANAYTTDLLAYLDKILISAADTKANLNQVSDISDQMLTIQNQATIDNPTGYAKLDEMQVKYKMNGIQHDLQKKATEATRVPTVVLFDAQNGSQFLINGQIDTKHRDMDVIKVNSGLIKIKVVLEPLP